MTYRIRKKPKEEQEQSDRANHEMMMAAIKQVYPHDFSKLTKTAPVEPAVDTSEHFERRLEQAHLAGDG